MSPTAEEIARLARTLAAVRADLEGRGYLAAGVLGRAAVALFELANERDRLAAELEVLRREGGAERCACGCGRLLRKPPRGPRPKWATEACRKRAARVRGSSGVLRSA